MGRVVALLPADDDIEAVAELLFDGGLELVELRLLAGAEGTQGLQGHIGNLK